MNLLNPFVLAATATEVTAEASDEQKIFIVLGGLLLVVIIAVVVSVVSAVTSAVAANVDEDSED